MNHKKSLQIASDIADKLFFDEGLISLRSDARNKTIDIIQSELMGPEQPDMSRYEQVKRLCFTKKYRMIRVKYLGPTTYKGSRVKLYDEDLPRASGESITIPYDHKYNSCLEIAVYYLLGMGFNVQGCVIDHVLVEWGHPYKSIKGE